MATTILYHWAVSTVSSHWSSVLHVNTRLKAKLKYDVLLWLLSSFQYPVRGPVRSDISLSCQMDCVLCSLCIEVCGLMLHGVLSEVSKSPAIPSKRIPEIELFAEIQDNHSIVNISLHILFKAEERFLGVPG
jgi:hypothetical protein